MSWGHDIYAHHGPVRELLHKPLAKIARNASDNYGWFCRIHLVGVVFAGWGRRFCSPRRWRHRRISGGPEVGIVQVNITLKTLHAVAIALAGNQAPNFRFYRIQR